MNELQRVCFNETNVKDKMNPKHILKTSLDIMWLKNSFTSGRNAIKWSEYKKGTDNKCKKEGKVVDFLKEALSIFLFADHYTEQTGRREEHKDM